MNAVSFSHVTKTYPSYNQLKGGIKNFLFHLPSAVREIASRRTVLNDVSFNIPQGSTFGFVGRNGAGKSTTLGLIANVLRPDKGEITVKGRVSPLLELGAGFHPELSGHQNIKLNGVLMGLTLREIKAHIDEIVDFAELADFIHQPIRTYSSGMLARLGFAVVATLRPEILLIDEVLSVGDLAFMRKCEAKIEEFRSNPDVTIIIVSHDLTTIPKICDQVAFIDHGILQMVGSPDEVVNKYISQNSTLV